MLRLSDMILFIYTDLSIKTLYDLKARSVSSGEINKF
jgi:hypothetical protein